MSTNRRQDAATATLGYGGLVGAGALRHHALDRAYGGGKRPPLAQEVKFLRRGAKGRRLWLAGAALAVPSSTSAAYGTSQLLTPNKKVAKKDDQRRSFLSEGLSGTKQALVARSTNLSEKPPAKLVAGNYALGGLIGAGAGGLTNLALRRRRLPGGLKAGLAGAAGVAAGSATIPLQSKLVQRASHGKYEATATGLVRRHKRRAQPVTKMSPRTAAQVAGAKAGAHWTVNLSRVADRLEPYEPRRRAARPLPKVVARHLPNAHRVSTKLVKTGRTKGAETLRAVSYDVSSVQDKDQLVRQVATGQGALRKRDDVGAALTRGQRRRRVTAAGSAPVVGDFTSAAVAARLAPERYKRRTAAQVYGGSTVGGLAGNALGAAGAVALARKSPGFARGAKAVNRVSERAAAGARKLVGLKPKTGPGLAERLAAHPRTPAGAKRAWSSGPARAVRANPEVAAAGALGGGAIGGTIGQQGMLTHTLARDDRYRAKATNPQASHGTRINKADPPKPLTQREKRTLARRKQHSAALSVIGGTTGLAALGATLASSRHSPLKAATKLRLAKAPVPLLTTGAGTGGVNALIGARIQRKEAQQTVAKAFGLKPTGVLRPPGMPRTPGMRSGYIRQRRLASGLTSTATVRGGLA